MEENKNKKIFKIIGNVFFWLIVAVVGCFAAVSITSRATNGRFGDTQYLVVLSASMDGEKKEEYEIKTVPVKSLIKIDLVGNNEDNFYSNLKMGDVITFNYLSLNNETITHRIVEEPTKDSNGVYKYVVQGDAVENDRQTLYSDGRTGEIIGKVTFVSKPLGEIYFFINSKVGTLVLVVLPMSALCIYEIIKIIKILSDRKKEKEAAAVSSTVSEKDAEIERLKKLLEEKENGNTEGNQNNEE